MSKKYTTLSQFPVLRNALYARSRYLIGGTSQHVRNNSTMPPAGGQSPDAVEKSGMLFVDSLFPVRFGIWDIRHFVAMNRQTQVLSSLKHVMDQIHINDFRVDKIEARVKDGGAFVKFKYMEPAKVQDSAEPLETPSPEAEIQTEVHDLGEVETWAGKKGGDITHARIQLRRIKDGGPFLTSKDREPAKVQDNEQSLETSSLEAEIQKEVHDLGGVETWTGNKGGDVWLVRGKPWKEDMRRYAANTIKVHFEGPDIYQETLYDLMRPYGQITDITNPIPVPAGTLRYSTVKFTSPRSATRAHNCLHGFTLVDDPTIPGQSSAGKPTRLATVYERQLRGQVVREWLSGHPRIVGPVVLFLIGTLSYLIFDPIRTFAVQAKVMEWLDYREFRIIKWIQHNTLDRVPFFRKTEAGHNSPGSSGGNESSWKDRQDAEQTLRAYLHEVPSTIAFVHGPQGSGKSSMLDRALKNTNRRTLVIDCEPLNKARSDADVINGLATQTAGLSSSVETQLKEILEVVGNALKGVSARHKEIEKAKELARSFTEQTEAHTKEALEKMEQVTHHDGRLDALVGGGVIGELGVGDERMSEKDQNTKSDVQKAVTKSQAVVKLGKQAVPKRLDTESKVDSTKSGWGGNPVGAVQGVVKDVVKDTKQSAEKLLTATKDQLGMVSEEESSPQHGLRYKERTEIDEEIQALPVVVIKNYSTKSTLTDELVTVLAEWAAGLADGGLAHVVVMSDNRDNGRRLEKALPAKPLISMALTDADPASALSFVRDKLKQYGVRSDLTRDQTLQIDRLGGRSSDLEALCHKVKNGMPVEMAIDDIITRGVGELRKNAFGEIDDAQSMTWSKEQVFFILKALAKSDELPYYDVLVEFPFKGDEAALRSMEHSELISITTQDGRPSTIRPGRPVYRYVFQRLVGDSIFRSIQDIALNEKAIASAESAIRTYEEELLKLEQIRPLDSGILSSGATRQRADFLLKKLYDAESKVEKLEATNATLKKNLKRP